LDESVLERLTEIVREVRGDRSQRDLADLFAVSQSTIHGWETGKSLPDLRNLEKIARLRGQLTEQLVADLYGRNTQASIQQQIESMNNRERAWLLMLIAQSFIDVEAEIPVE